MRKQKIIVVLIVLIAITLSIGYVLYRTNVDVESLNKTAEAKNLNVIFKKVDNPTEVYSTDASASISENRKNLYISAPNLIKKGAYAEFPVTIKNIGTFPAKLRSINQYSVGNVPVLVSYNGIGVTDQVLYPDEEKKFYVKVLLLKEPSSNIEFNFQINFNYIQAN